MKRIALSMLFIASSVHAKDFETVRARIQAREAVIKQKLIGLGASPEFSNGNEFEEENKKPRGPLFRLHGSINTTQVAAGSLVFGKLVNRLVVGGETTPVIIQLDSKNRSGAIGGLRMIGKARQGSTEGRINIDFDRLVLLAGNTVEVDASGLDETGALGLEAQVYSSRALMAAGALASSFVSGYAASQQTQSVNDFGFSQTNRTGRNSLLQGVAQTAADQAKRFIDRETEEKPILVLDAAAEVAVFLNKELRL